MDSARHVIETFFATTVNPMVRHHLDSFNDFLDIKLPRFIQASNPLKLLFEDDRSIYIYIGGKDGTKLKYKVPIGEDSMAIVPHMCRLENKTYKFDFYGDITVEYNFPNDATVTKNFEDIFLGSIPLMLKSNLCYLRPLDSEQLYDMGECKFELGGYFIIDGQERVLLTQESLGTNMFYSKKRRVYKLAQQSRALTESDSNAELDTSSKSEDYEYIAGIYSTSEDGTRGPYGHLIRLGPKNSSPNDPKDLAKIQDFAVFSTQRLITVQLPGFIKPVPLLSVFYALGITSDKDLYDTILYGIPSSQRTLYDGLFLTLILSHERYLQQLSDKEDDKDEDPNLLALRIMTRTRSLASIYVNLYTNLFPHCELQDNESTSTFYRRKALILGHMTRMVMEIDIGVKDSSDRDHFRFKRLAAAGELCFQEFIRIYMDVTKAMTVLLDSRVEFEKEVYKGKKLIELVQEDTLRTKYWRSQEFLERFKKSFKGRWNEMDGVSQVLTRFSYVGTIANLRRVNLNMDKDTKQVEPRRIHSSSWGLLCPVDNPDGGNIGMIKSLTLLSTITTQINSNEIKDIIFKEKNFLKLGFINPSLWNNLWTKIFLNSDLIGVIKQDTESFHFNLMKIRREGKINKVVSLCWNRLDNEYLIFCDAGRPCRPIYQEGIKPETIKRLTDWTKILDHMDFIDAQESECLRISMEPFHPTQLSEIHGIAIFSASASINPFSEHNQGPRNMFSCQQVKQACSWYNTAFNKRFDTISTHLHSPQKPISQTWTLPYILGGNGCMPYGENTIVAIGIFTGYNQEDSILLNDNALKRGLFQTSYYHSYDFEEESIVKNFNGGSVDVLVSTIFCNPVTNSKYREIVVRKKDKDYSLLDADGIIKIGSEITPDTILVGTVYPIQNSVGEIINFVDKSSLPKRGQHGIVDGIYRYTTSDGLQGVKIRISESRSPILGDKFSARHGQKGTCGLRIAEEDMPFTASGLRPDLIVNPHAFPSRMTIGQFLESMSNKIGISLGTFIDGNAFSTQNRIMETKDILIQLGYHPYGNEIMYNGMNGEMIESEIFMGPTYYLRSKLMTEDKINYRSTGPMTLMTHQPLEGRSNDGGLRIGEMERDGLLSHGLMSFLNESMMKRSDEHNYLFSKEDGLLDYNDTKNTQITTLNMPYSMGLYLHEIESMHIQVKLESN
jgi:DNA-directed RNA polymerase II subunit RPB2